jgi:hypothetical protein
MERKFICDICDKKYKSYLSFWNHNNRFHKSDIPILSPKLNSDIPILSPKLNSDIPILSPKLNSDILILPQKHICNYCDKELSSYKNLHRHLKTCKKIKDPETIINDLKKKLTDYEEQFAEIKKTVTTIMNKNCKVHPKTLQKIQNILTNNNSNNNNTINNGTINNININIVPFGKEDTTNILSNKTKREILNRKHQALYACIEKVHFNKDYPQFNNIMITNMKTNEAHIYNENTKTFILANKDDVIGNLIDNRLTDIEEFKELLIDDLPPGTVEIINKLINKWDTEKDVQDKVKLILFNNRKITLDTKKVSDNEITPN